VVAAEDEDLAEGFVERGEGFLDRLLEFLAVEMMVHAGRAVLLQLLEHGHGKKAVQQIRPQRGDDPHALAAHQDVEQPRKPRPCLLGKPE